MIVRCSENDRNRIVDYVSSEPEVNLYILGDIETYGINAPVSVTTFEDNGALRSLILSLHGNYVVYTREKLEQPKEVAQLIQAEAGGNPPRHLNARLDIARSLTPFFPKMRLEECKLAVCRNNQEMLKGSIERSLTVRQMGGNDFEELFELLDAIDESTHIPASSDLRKQAIARKMEALQHGCLTVGVYKDHKLVSTASTSAAYSKGAMMTGVATLPHERGKGYATIAVKKLCADCFDKGMSHLCLYYHNPIAARIYKRLGFEDIADFGMLSKV